MSRPSDSSDKRGEFMTIELNISLLLNFALNLAADKVSEECIHQFLLVLTMF